MKTLVRQKTRSMKSKTIKENTRGDAQKFLQGIVPLGNIIELSGSRAKEYAVKACKTMTESDYITDWIDVVEISAESANIRDAQDLNSNFSQWRAENAADAFNLLTSLAAGENAKLIVFNSISMLSLVRVEDMEKTLDDKEFLDIVDPSQRGEIPDFLGMRAKIISDGLSKLMELVKENGSTIIFIGSTEKDYWTSQPLVRDRANLCLKIS